MRKPFEYKGCKIKPEVSEKPVLVGCNDGVNRYFRNYWLVTFPDKTWTKVGTKGMAIIYIDQHVHSHSHGVIRKFTSTDSLTKYTTDAEAYTMDGGDTWRWTSNDSVIEVGICKQYGIPCNPTLQEAARESHVAEVLANYRKNQPAEPSEEERRLARAAYGPGKEVVDVVSGRKFTT